jgi:hypothetical protein
LETWRFKTPGRLSERCICALHKYDYLRYRKHYGKVLRRYGGRHCVTAVLKAESLTCSPNRDPYPTLRNTITHLSPVSLHLCQKYVSGSIQKQLGVEKDKNSTRVETQDTQLMNLQRQGPVKSTSALSPPIALRSVTRMPKSCQGLALFFMKLATVVILRRYEECKLISCNTC